MFARSCATRRTDGRHRNIIHLPSQPTPWYFFSLHLHFQGLGSRHSSIYAPHAVRGVSAARAGISSGLRRRHVTGPPWKHYNAMSAELDSRHETGRSHNWLAGRTRSCGNVRYACHRELTVGLGILGQVCKLLGWAVVAACKCYTVREGISD